MKEESLKYDRNQILLGMGNVQNRGKAHLWNMGRNVVVFSAMATMLGVLGCAEPKPVLTPAAPPASVNSEAHHKAEHGAYLPPPKETQVGPASEENPERPVSSNPPDERPVRQAEAEATNAERASGEAERENDQARVAASRSKDASDKAAKAASAGDIGAAQAAATDAGNAAAEAEQAARAAAGSAKNSKSCAETAQAGLVETQNQAVLPGKAEQSAIRATTAAEKAESAAMSAAAHSFVAGENAALARKSVELAKAVDAAKKTASEVAALAVKTSTSRDRAESEAETAATAASKGDVRAAQIAAKSAKQAADEAAGHASQVEKGAIRLTKEIDIVNTSGAFAVEGATSTQEALAELSREAEQKAKAASLAAVKAAILAEQSVEKAAEKAQLAINPASQPTAGAATKPSKPDLKSAMSRKSEELDLGRLPDLPEIPGRRDNPQGIIAPTTQPVSKPIKILGKWKQVEGNDGPDCFPGGYGISILIFRADGILEAQRTFGKKGEVSLKWQVGYEWGKEGLTLVLGRDPALRPPPVSLNGFSLQGGGAVHGATQPFPVTLKCTKLQSSNIRLDDKTYAPIE